MPHRHPGVLPQSVARLAPSALDPPFRPDLRFVADAVENFFSKMTRQHVRHGVFRSIVDLQAAIAYLAEN